MAIVAEEDSDDEMNTTISDDAHVKALQSRKSKGKIKLAQELSDLVTYVQSVPFHGFQGVRQKGTRFSINLVHYSVVLLPIWLVSYHFGNLGVN